MAVVAVCFAFTSCGGNSIFGGKSWDTIADVQKNIDGTVWTYTQPNDIWTKLEFKNGKCYVYHSNRNKGSWGDPYCDDYEINEVVKKQTSEKNVVVSIGKDYYVRSYTSTYMFGDLPNYGERAEYTLSPKEEILYTASGSPLSVHPEDYKW